MSEVVIRDHEPRSRTNESWWVVDGVQSWSTEDDDAARADVECGSCGEGVPTGECPKSKRSCGHHCNHVWTHDACDWCGIEFLGDGETVTPPSVAPTTGQEQ